MKRILVAFFCILLLSACGAETAPAPTDTPGPPATLMASPSATATVSPTPSLPPGHYAAATFTPVAGWKTYVNDTLGYQFSYPATGMIEETGFSGIPTDEIVPFGMTFSEYFDYLNHTLPGNMCVSVGLTGGAITIRPPDEPVGKFTQPCPGMGIGTVRLDKATETFDIGGRSYAANGDQMFNEETGERIGEFYFIEVDNGFHVTYICHAGPNEDSPLERTLRQILSSIQWTAPPLSTVPTPTCAGAYTHLLPGRYAVVTGGPDDPPNRVRAAPNTGAEVIAQIYPGTIVQVLEGPVCTDGLVFWKVENASIPGGAGWTAEGDGSEYFLDPYRP